MHAGEPPPVLTWRRLYLGLSGRIDRESFWLWGLVPWLLLAWAFAATVHSILGLADAAIVRIGLSLLSVAFVPVIVKRLHDRNRSGWLVLVCFLPAVYGGAIDRLATGDIRGDYALFAPLLVLQGLWAWIVVYECSICRGTAGANKYGPLPPRFGL